MTTQPIKDHQTVTAEGKSVRPLIAGVRLRALTLHLDERGSVCEIYNPAWGFDAAPLVYAYQGTIHPGRVKGWVLHHEQEDRVFPGQGRMKWVLYDARPDSPTHGMVNEIFLSEQNRMLLFIPTYVYHAVQNIGTVDAVYINLPTRPYRHDDPDTYRLPFDTDQIPYRFDRGLGW